MNRTDRADGTGRAGAVADRPGDEMVDGYPQRAYAAALSALPEITLARLAALLRGRSPAQAWALVAGRHRDDGLMGQLFATRHPDAVAAWRAAATDQLLQRVWAACATGGFQVLLPADPEFPHRLHDVSPPVPLLFARGPAAISWAPVVAVVGTRNATNHGRSWARQLGSDLATSGVHVVSGLARGIDGAVHRGVLDAGERDPTAAPPIGVVGSGLDVVYPREHAELWAAVGAVGLLLSEAPPGGAPLAWRFPLRNRLVAAVADAVVVVESRHRGGSLITVDLALERGTPVLAMPGSTANPAAAGTNQLLRDGAAPALDAGDVLAALRLSPVVAPVSALERRPRPSAADLVVYRAVDVPRTAEGVALVSGLPIVDVAMGLARLQRDGWLAQVDGWFEAVGEGPR